MIMFAVYRPRQPATRMMSAEAIAAAITDNDVKLVKLAMRTGKPVQLGLDGENVIIRAVTDKADDSTSFEALYDTSYTITDLFAMEAAKVDTPDQVPPELFVVSAIVPIELACRIRVALPAANAGDAGASFRKLLKTDPMFLSSFHEELVTALEREIAHEDTLRFAIEDVTSTRYEPLEPALKLDDKPWHFLDPAG